MRSGLLLLALALPAGCGSPRGLDSLMQGGAMSPPSGEAEERTLRRHHASTGALEREWEVLAYPDGRAIRHGADRSWYPDGAPRFERTHQHGEPTGAWRSYYPGGGLESESLISGGEGPGEAPGRTQWWYESGQLASAGGNTGGVKSGEWQGWHAGGELAEEGGYTDGMREGTWRLWYPSGEPEAEGLYRENRRVGPWKHWSPMGECVIREDGTAPEVSEPVPLPAPEEVIEEASEPGLSEGR